MFFRISSRERQPNNLTLFNEMFELFKGSLCGINIYAIHQSEDIWTDPTVFEPERFLNEDGEICNTDKIIPFGFGSFIHMKMLL